MPKKKTEKKALSGNRTLSKSLPQYIWAQTYLDPSPWSTQGSAEGQGWHLSTAVVGTPFIWYSTYFDLSGYSLADMTTQPVNITLQEASNYLAVEDATSGQTGLRVLDLVSTEKPDVDSVVTNMDRRNGPSYSLSELSFDQVIWSQFRLLGHDTAIWTNTYGILTNLTTNLSGSGQALALEKLWLTRIIIPDGDYNVDPGTYMQFPASTFVMNAVIYQEDELPYLMRLRRSFELGQR